MTSSITAGASGRDLPHLQNRQSSSMAAPYPYGAFVQETRRAIVHVIPRRTIASVAWARGTHGEKPLTSAAALRLGSTHRRQDALRRRTPDNDGDSRTQTAPPREQMRSVARNTARTDRTHLRPSAPHPASTRSRGGTRGRTESLWGLAMRSATRCTWARRARS